MDHVNAHQMVASCINVREILGLTALWVDASLLSRSSSLLIFLFNVVLVEETCNAIYDGKSYETPLFLGHLHTPPTTSTRPGQDATANAQRVTTTEQQCTGTGCPICT
jgi:hypothetical protein